MHSRRGIARRLSKAFRERSPRLEMLMSRLLCCLWVTLLVLGPAFAEEPRGELARKLAGVKFEKYADAPGYSEGPTWSRGELFFCSGPLLRVDAAKRVHRFLEVGPAGTVLRADGHLLIADNKHRALLDLSPEGKVAVVA